MEDGSLFSELHVPLFVWSFGSVCIKKVVLGHAACREKDASIKSITFTELWKGQMDKVELENTEVVEDDENPASESRKVHEEESAQFRAQFRQV